MNLVTRGTALAGGLNMDGLTSRVKRIRISAPDDGSENDTGWNVPDKALVLDVFLDVETAEATGTTKTLDVGLLSSESGGDANGFLAGASVSATGLVKGDVTYTDGTNTNYISARTRGVLLWDGIDGSDAAAEPGTGNPTAHLTDSVTAKSVSYTAASADFAELVAYLYIVYLVVEQ